MIRIFNLIFLLFFFTAPSYAQSPSSEKGLRVLGQGTASTVTIDGRDVIVYTPPSPKPIGARPLLVVLHGGFGDAAQIRSYIGLEPYADQAGFLIVYPNGSKVARFLSDKRKGWNGGECCGLPSISNVDDVEFITHTVDKIVADYGVDRAHVYGTGHSNGAIMTYRLMCETNLYRAAVPYSGTLSLDVETCPAARGKRILGLHGQNDLNVPFEGGHTVKGINKRTDYRSQHYTRDVFVRSGAQFQALVLPGAEHKPETLNAALLATENVTLPQKIVSFLGLLAK